MITNSLTGFYVKQRPKSHKLEGVTTKTHPGFVISRMPRKYKLNAPQRRVKDAAKACGIKTGMSRADLVTKMRTCIPQQFGAK